MSPVDHANFVVVDASENMAKKSHSVAQSERPLGLSISPTPMVNQIDFFAISSKNFSDLGVSPTQVLNQTNFIVTATLENPSILGVSPTSLVNQEDFNVELFHHNMI